VSFTGGGINCSGGVPDPLIGHFSGDPDFSFIYLFNGEQDTLDFGLYDVAFPSDTTFTLVGLSLEDNNCRTPLEDTAYYVYIEVPEPVIYGETEVCETESLIYRAGHADYAVNWDISGARYETDSTEEGHFARVTWTDTGEQEVRLQYTEYEYGCTTNWSVFPVAVYPMPETFTMDTAVCFQQEGDLALHFDVDPDDVLFWPELSVYGSIMALDSTGYYHIIHTNSYNCVDTSYIRVVSSCVAQLYVPEAFTPGNNDGLNDRLEIFGFFTDLELKIYSPSGILIFETTEVPLRYWDGTYGPYRKEMPAGSYYWTAVFSEGDGEPIEKSGVVTLIR
jgi:gliding motility-associated-like protein